VILRFASVDALNNTMDSFLRQYETNRKTWVEVLNQQRELANMRYSLISTDQQYMALSLKLAIMAGRLDELAGVK
jgi:adhesin transport system outer membrane protein